MATSGSTSANGGGNATWASTTLEVWRNWVDVGSNASSMHFKLSIYRQYSISSSASKSYSVNLNGQTVASGTTTVGGVGTKVIAEGDVIVYHNADGSKWLDFSFSQQWDVTLSGTWVGTMSNSGGFWIDSIPRTSNITLSTGTQTMGSAITIYTNRASTAFTHYIYAKFGSATIEISGGVTDSVAWTLPTATLAPQIPNATSGWGTIYCDTYNGGTYIGTSSQVFTANLPSSVVPSFTSVTHSENVTAVSTAVGMYVQKMSKLNLAITGATGIYGSTISSYLISFDGVNYGSSSAVSNIVQGSGSLTITGTITDSRGRTASKSVTVTVLAYSPPVVTALTMVRANSDGTDNQLGTYVKVTRTGTVSSLMNGATQKNVLKYTIKTKLRSDSVWTTNKALTQIAGLSLTGSETLAQGTFDITKSYDIRLEITDVFNTTIALGVISSGQVTMSWGRTGIGVGKVWESGALDVGGNVNVEGDITVTNGKKIVFPHLINGTTTVSPLGIATDGSAVTLTAGTDLNTVKTTGIYMCSGAVNRPSGVADWGYIEVIRHNDSFVMQRFTDFWSDRVWYRRLQNNTWMGWIPLDGRNIACSLNNGGNGYASNTWYRIDWGVMNGTTNGVNTYGLFNDTDNLFYPPEDGYYVFLFWCYFVQSIETGFYVELWTKNDTTNWSNKSIVSTWAPDNGYNFYHGSVISYLRAGCQYETVIKHTDGSYTRSSLDQRLQVFKI